jgi:enoyl-CoA hydratase/carnithine racemase
MSETATILELLVEQRGTVPWLIIQRQEPLSSARALEYGLVNYVDNDVDARLDWLLQQLLDKSPAAIRPACTR